MNKSILSKLKQASGSLSLALYSLNSRNHFKGFYGFWAAFFDIYVWRTGRNIAYLPQTNDWNTSEGWERESSPPHLHRRDQATVSFCTSHLLCTFHVCSKNTSEGEVTTWNAANWAKGVLFFFPSFALAASSNRCKVMSRISIKQAFSGGKREINKKQHVCKISIDKLLDVMLMEAPRG